MCQCEELVLKEAQESSPGLRNSESFQCDWKEKPTKRGERKKNGGSFFCFPGSHFAWPISTAQFPFLEQSWLFRLQLDCCRSL